MQLEAMRMGNIFRSISKGSAEPQPEKKMLRELIGNSLYEFYSPDGRAEIQIVFFHGMEKGDSSQSYLETWKSSDGSTFWPISLLSKQFSTARILSVSYDSSSMKTDTQGRLDLYLTAENLVQDLTSNDGVIPENDCPIIMIGKDLGCFVIEAICKHAHHTGNAKNAKLIDNIKGIFFFCPLTMGTKGISSTFTGDMAKRLKVHDKEISRLNQDFFGLKKGWEIRGVAPANRDTGTENAVLPREIAEASGRYGTDTFKVIPREDISTICCPQTNTSASFKYLTEFITESIPVVPNREMC